MGPGRTQIMRISGFAQSKTSKENGTIFSGFSSDLQKKVFNGFSVQIQVISKKKVFDVSF